jgi:acyl carrier protein
MTITKSDIDQIVVAETRVKIESLVETATLTDLELDSLDMVSIVFSLEEKFKINLETDDLKDIVTYRQFIDVVVANAPQQ